MPAVENLETAMTDMSLPEIIQEVGYTFTSSVEECKNNMLNFGAREPTAADVARIISMMVKYHATVQGGPQMQTPGNFWICSEIKKDPMKNGHESWNVEVFVQTLKELVPNLNWKDVILHLDHPEFVVLDRQGLGVLFTILRLGLQSAGYPANIFPLEYLYRRWTNLEGQMSLISNILKNPDIFNFADYPFHPVPVDLLKSPPEADNKDTAVWRCLHLVELLLYAAEHQHYVQVHELFKFPLQHCPDILLLTLLQIVSPVTTFRQELLTTLIPIFLGNHPNSSIILHHAWNSQSPNIKSIIKHAIADWYLRGESDLSKLSRILDIAQNLKALSVFLNVHSFLYTIDLACLASRRKYLNLDKWLTDKIRDRGEIFISALVKFLQKRCPEEQLPKAAQLPHETITTMLSCLQLCISTVQPELQEAICNVHINCQTFIFSKPRPMSAVSQPYTRVFETPFNPAISGQLIAQQPGVIESITNLTAAVANINLGPSTSTVFSMPGSIGPLVNAPGSPSRLMDSAMTLSAHNSNINMGAFSRMAPTPAVEKPKIPDPIHYPEVLHNISKEIEEEANSYFQRIYNHTPHPLSTDEVFELLKKFQDSPNKRERDVFNCMIQNLFEEYKFFPQYPDKELHITAQLFGGIIEKKLTPNHVSLSVALRYVFDALRKPDDSKMYYFGIVALDQFKSRLKEYQKFCEHIRTIIPHFNRFPPHLIEYIQYGIQSREPPTKPQGVVLPTSLATLLNQNSGAVSTPNRTIVCASPSTTISKATNAAGALGSRPSIAIATNIDTLLTATDREEKITVPPESVQDKTAFIFNNLSQLNLQTKCDELKDIITEDYYPWLSQYLVMKRASIEFNFHALYSSFLDFLKICEVNTLVRKETYRNIRTLLHSDKGIANFSDRSLLKNLGHWLGMLTLARNLPILYVDIDLKSLLLEAYHKGQQELLYVVPFVAKVLESCGKSVVFKPPNPWTMALMNTLAELHQEPDLKLNLKFEIEVLCKNLSIDVADLKPSIYLKDPEKFKHINIQLSQPKVVKEASSSNTMNVVVPLDQTLVPNPQLQMMPPPSTLFHLEDIIATQNSLIPIETNFLEVTNMSEPKFHYLDINVASTSTFDQKICINPHILLLQTFPHLKQCVKPAIERSVQEWVHPVVDRSIKYALTTSEQVIRKDFALDPDEVQMRACAYHMMRNFTAAVAMITCRDQIISSICTNLKTAFISAVIPGTNQEIIDSAAIVLATENMELACAFIQKTAVEKALSELDKRLFNDYEVRKRARLEGKQYHDEMTLLLQERIPERLRLRIGGPTDAEISVYKGFACNIPGFIPLRDVGVIIPKVTAQDQIQQHLTYPVLTPTHESVHMTSIDELTALINAAEMYVTTSVSVVSLAAQNTSMQLLLDCLMLARRNRDVASGCNLLQRAVEGLLEVHVVQPETAGEHIKMMLHYREIHLRVLKLLENGRVYGQAWTTKQITTCITECREDLRYNIEAIDCLIKNQLVNVPQYDIGLVHMMDNGNNYTAVAFAMRLVQLYLIDERNVYIGTSDLYHTTEMLYRIVSHSRTPVPEGLASLVEMLRTHPNPSCLGERSFLGPTAHLHGGLLSVQSRDYNDPSGLQERTENLLREWHSILQVPSTEMELMLSFTKYIQRTNISVILKSEDLLNRFLRIATQICVENVYQQLEEDRLKPASCPPKREKYYEMCDSFVKFMSLFIKCCNDSNDPTPKLNLLNKALGIIAGCLLQDHDSRLIHFQQLPYHRLLVILFLDMNVPDPILDSMNFQILTAFCHTLHVIRPEVAPAFCYAWLKIVAHRSFIDKMLSVTPQQKGWGMYSTLIIDLIKFLDPFLRNTELAPPVMALYKGTLKVLLVLLHDFPEFLCDYHYGFCDEIPPNCIQLRNLILSAFPRNMHLPDPFAPNLKVDLLPEISLPPRAIVNYDLLVSSPQFKKDLDAYLKDRAPVTFLSELRSSMQVLNDQARRYNSQLINAVVMYVGTQAISHIREKGQTPNMTTIAHSAHMDIFQNFTVDFDFEGRYLFLNAIANQLRYPNSHTHYFSCCLLYLFAEANSEAIQEQITRILLERLIVNRPHPWGLLITFIELLKNPIFKFWSHEFVHCAPEIERLFNSVIRSSGADKTGAAGSARDIP